MLINVNPTGYDLTPSTCWCIMYIKKISGYHLMWPVGIAHVRGYLHNSHMTKTTCDVCLAGLPLYLTNLYHMIIMQISW